MVGIARGLAVGALDVVREAELGWHSLTVWVASVAEVQFSRVAASCDWGCCICLLTRFHFRGWLASKLFGISVLSSRVWSRRLWSLPLHGGWPHFTLRYTLRWVARCVGALPTRCSAGFV